MNEFDWIIDHDKDKFDLINVIMDFKKKFPNNLVNAKHKRMDILRGYIKQMDDLEIPLMETGLCITKDRFMHDISEILWMGEQPKCWWWDSRVSKKIKTTKKGITMEGLEYSTDSSNYWSSFVD